MGHIRLGTIPTSLPWRRVVAAVIAPGGEGTSSGGGHVLADRGVAFDRPHSEADDKGAVGSIATIAATTLEAARASLRHAKRDEGLRFTFYLLTQVALASRNDNWIEQLAAQGVTLRASDSIADLTAAFHSAVDERLEQPGARSDLADMAQRAAGHALCHLASQKADTLFGSSGEHLRYAVRPISSARGFGKLSQLFFGSFLTQFLNFYLSRITASQLGRGFIGQLSDITDFNTALRRHCDQTAGIITDFASEWYSKTEYKHGVDAKRAGGFVAVAIDKLQAELERQSVR